MLDLTVDRGSNQIGPGQCGQCDFDFVCPCLLTPDASWSLDCPGRTHNIIGNVTSVQCVCVCVSMPYATKSMDLEVNNESECK